MQSSLLEIAEVQLALCKGDANERKENLFSISRVQLALCKGNAKIRLKKIIGHRIITISHFTFIPVHVGLLTDMYEQKGLQTR